MHEERMLGLSEAAWEECKRRAAAIKPLVEMEHVSRQVADEAASSLGISRRYVYELIRRLKAGKQLTTDFAPQKPTGGKGKSRLPIELEEIISESIRTFYLTRQKRSKAAVLREIQRKCFRIGKPAPSRNTIERRISRLDPLTVSRTRDGFRNSRTLDALQGSTPKPEQALDVVQMDHTKVDLIIVDQATRQPIGRPWLTLAIDVFSRCIAGMLLTLENPSATSVALCLAHVVSNKAAWLERLGLPDLAWAMHGKPGTIHSDNAKEFHSEALRRGCEQHGIAVQYRPCGQPHFGGIIERIIGTAMTMIHELPGTTFSNIQERGTYKPEQHASLTLRELEQWLTLAICSYHETVHSSLNEPPIACWNRAVQKQELVTVSDPEAFIIDFLPIIYRKIGRAGFIIDHVNYFADCLKPLIAKRKQLDRFVLRRDPRDLSRIWVLDPSSNQYFEIPYRTISNPAVTLGEHRNALRELRKRGRASVNEAAIFRMVDQMRAIEQAAISESKHARKNVARRDHLSSSENNKEETALLFSDSDVVVAKRFDVEEW